MRNDNFERLPLPQYLIRVAIALVVLGVGMGVLRYFMVTKKETKKVALENLGELVAVVSATPARHEIRIQANGHVLPAKVVALSAEVGGRVVWMNEELIPGSRVLEGTKLVRVDGRDYNLALEQQRSMVNNALTALEVERSRKAIAEREWQLMGGGQTADALALRDPQLQSAEASVKAARSGLARAQLAAGKTLLTAPFNAVIKDKNADIGQLVGPQTPLVTLIGSDSYWVQVSVPVDRLQWLTIPGYGGATADDPAAASPVEIFQEVGHERICRTGRVLRLLGDLDPMGRMARVLVEIDDPLLERAETPRCVPSEHARDSDLPLLVGAYVTVEITGRSVDNVVELGREAIRGGDHVYVMTAENKLEVRGVEILWRRRDTVLINKGLAGGERVVVSPLAGAIDGMKLRLPAPRPEAADAAAASGAAASENP